MRRSSSWSGTEGGVGCLPSARGRESPGTVDESSGTGPLLPNCARKGSRNLPGAGTRLAWGTMSESGGASVLARLLITQRCLASTRGDARPTGLHCGITKRGTCWQARKAQSGRVTSWGAVAQIAAGGKRRSACAEKERTPCESPWLSKYLRRARSDAAYLS